MRLRTTNADPDDVVADSTNLVAVATLVPGPNSAVSTDPSVLNTILVGRRFDSIHPFADDEADGSIASMDMADPYGIGYMRFPELIIRQPGTYRIRITLIRIRNSVSDPPISSAGNGLAVQVIDSNPIVVVGGQATNLTAYNGKHPKRPRRRAFLGTPSPFSAAALDSSTTFAEPAIVPSSRRGVTSQKGQPSTDAKGPTTWTK